MYTDAWNQTLQGQKVKQLGGSPAHEIVKKYTVDFRINVPFGQKL